MVYNHATFLFTTVLCTLKEENKNTAHIFLPHMRAKEMVTGNMVPLDNQMKVF
jgi:hypothetical protein